MKLTDVLFEFLAFTSSYFTKLHDKKRCFSTIMVGLSVCTSVHVLPQSTYAYQYCPIIIKLAIMIPFTFWYS